MLSIEVRSMTEITCWEGLDRIFRQSIGVRTWRGRQGFLFLKVRPHESSIVKSNVWLKIFALIWNTKIFDLGIREKSRFWSGLVLVVQISNAHQNQAWWVDLTQARAVSSSGGASWGAFLASEVGLVWIEYSLYSNSNSYREYLDTDHFYKNIASGAPS